MENKIESEFKEINKKILNLLDKSLSSIKIAVAWLSDKEILDLLIKKSSLGIDIEIITSDKNDKETVDEFFLKLKSSNALVLKINSIDDSIMHHKFCIIDERILITGSYNWSYNAKNNFENILIIKDESIIKSFLNEFLNIKKYSIEYFENNKEGEGNKISEFILNIRENIEDGYNKGVLGIPIKKDSDEINSLKFFSNELILITAKSEVFSRNLVFNFAFYFSFRHNLKSLFIGLSDNIHQIAMQFNTLIKTVRKDASDFDNKIFLASGIELLSPTLDNIVNTIKQYKDKHDINIVCIDYIEIIKFNSLEILKFLKLLSIQLNVPIFISSYLELKELRNNNLLIHPDKVLYVDIEESEREPYSILNLNIKTVKSRKGIINDCAVEYFSDVGYYQF
jgi:hypothetical protein